MSALVSALRATFGQAMGPRAAAIFDQELAAANRPTPEMEAQGRRDAAAMDVAWVGASRPLRTPPSNLEAEQALLGALLRDNRGFGPANAILEAQHFMDPAHGRIYQAIADLIEAGRRADDAAVAGSLEGSGVLRAVGGIAYLRQVLTPAALRVNVVEYAEAIRDAWQRRAAIDLSERLTDLADRTVGEAFEGSDPGGSAAHALAAGLASLLSESLRITRCEA